MKLLTKEIIKKLPALYATEKIALRDKVAVCKFFCPWGRYTAYVIEGSVSENDPKDFIFWGYVVSPLGGDCDEYGYFSLKELESVKHFSGLKIERDLHFSPTKCSEISDIRIL
jgi:hypothetical protein